VRSWLIYDYHIWKTYDNFRFEGGEVRVDVVELGLDRGDVGHQIDQSRFAHSSGNIHFWLDADHGVG